jgi:hypothetical protein
MKKRLESPTRRVNPVEEQRNRPRGYFGGGGGCLSRMDKKLGFEGPAAGLL